MANADYLVLQLDHFCIRQLPLDSNIAHIAVYGMENLGLEYFDYRHAGYISGMKNHLAVVECPFEVILEPLRNHGYMGVRQNSCAYHVLLSSP